MKKLIFALTFILAPSVNAGEILPYLYAEKFCQYRALGISADDARKAAINEAYISSGTPVKVYYHGKMIDSDVVDSAIAVIKRCPQFLK
jgi:hypothetical protein